MAKADPTKAWTPAAYVPADIAAIQALQRGEADPAQQMRVLSWLVNTVCGTYEPSFRPGADGERETCFAEGRRFVGLTLVKAMKLNLSTLRRDSNV